MKQNGRPQTLHHHVSRTINCTAWPARTDAVLPCLSRIFYRLDSGHACYRRKSTEGVDKNSVNTEQECRPSNCQKCKSTNYRKHAATQWLTDVQWHHEIHLTDSTHVTFHGCESLTGSKWCATYTQHITTERASLTALSGWWIIRCTHVNTHDVSDD